MNREHLPARNCPASPVFLSLFLCLCIICPVASQIHAQTVAQHSSVSPSSATRAAAIEHARAVAKDWLARGIPGFAVAVAIDGAIVYSEGFGYADLEQRVPAWATTKFRIGSVSKPLTSA